MCVLRYPHTWACLIGSWNSLKMPCKLGYSTLRLRGCVNNIVLLRSVSTMGRTVMARAATDITGKRFGRWVALRYVPGTRNPRTIGKWEVVCDCGTIRLVRTALLFQGISVSCGCYGREQSRKRASTHGMTNTPEFNSWTAMRKRCRYSKHPKYNRYGGRGIVICPEWDSFRKFYEDMGPRPEGTSLDRINLDGNYEPSNCRWVAVQEQSQNREVVKRAMVAGTSRTFYPDGTRRERKRPYKPRRK
jgi:hypothetical protein